MRRADTKSSAPDRGGRPPRPALARSAFISAATACANTSPRTDRRRSASKPAKSFCANARSSGIASTRSGQPRVVAAHEVHQQLRRAVAKRLVQGDAQAGFGDFGGAIPDQLLREARDVASAAPRPARSRRRRPCRAVRSPRSAGRAAAFRLLRQHQRIGRQRHAQLADDGLERESAGHVLVRIERRGGDLAGELGDQVEADGLRIARRDRSRCARSDRRRASRR